MKQSQKMIKLIGKYFREKENFTVAVIGSRGVDSQSLVCVQQAQLYIIARGFDDSFKISPNMAYMAYMDLIIHLGCS